MAKIHQEDRIFYIAFVVADFVVIAFSQLDLVVSSLFYEKGIGFIGKQNALCIFIHKYGHYMVFAVSGLTAAVLFFKKIHNGFVAVVKDKTIWFLLTSAAIVPGIIINGMLKTFWGRARPREIVEFGGSHTFSSPLVFAAETFGNSSFPSGHVSGVVWCLAIALILPKPWRKIAVTAVMAFGAVVAFTRIAYGAHFLSDTLFAFIISVPLIFYMWRKFDLDKS